MHLRAFVLQPLLEIAPDAAIPGMGRRGGRQGRSDQVLEKLADAA
jgi:7,8-dihydro-6-hydroxymethylpterin-pyrophosphokinase